MPDARFELGLDFAAPVRVTPLSSASLFTRVLAGRGMARASGVLSGHDLDRIEVRCDVPLPLQADGEDLGDVTEAIFEAERDAVTVLLARANRPERLTAGFRAAGGEPRI